MQSSFCRRPHNSFTPGFVEGITLLDKLSPGGKLELARTLMEEVSIKKRKDKKRKDLPAKDWIAISNAQSGLIRLLIEHKPALFEKIDINSYIGKNLKFDEEELSGSGEKGWVTLDIDDVNQTYRFCWSDVEKFGLSKDLYSILGKKYG